MRHSPAFIRLALVLLIGATHAGCEADHVEVTVCSGSPCCDRTCAAHGQGGGDVPAFEPIPSGALFFADVAAPAIYRLSPQGGYERIAGTGEPGESPDGVPAAAALIGPPLLLGLDPADGGLAFRDLATGAVKKIDSRGVLVTLRPSAR